MSHFDENTAYLAELDAILERGKQSLYGPGPTPTFHDPGFQPAPRVFHQTMAKSSYTVGIEVGIEVDPKELKGIDILPDSEFNDRAFDILKEKLTAILKNPENSASIFRRDSYVLVDMCVGNLSGKQPIKLSALSSFPSERVFTVFSELFRKGNQSVIPSVPKRKTKSNPGSPYFRIEFGIAHMICGSSLKKHTLHVYQETKADAQIREFIGKNPVFSVDYSDLSPDNNPFTGCIKSDDKMVLHKLPLNFQAHHPSPYGTNQFMVSMSEMPEIVESHRIALCGGLSKKFFIGLHEILKRFFKVQLPYFAATGTSPKIWELCDADRCKNLCGFANEELKDEAWSVFKRFFTRVRNHPDEFDMTFEQMIYVLDLVDCEIETSCDYLTDRITKVTGGKMMGRLCDIGSMAIHSYTAISMVDLKEETIQLRARTEEMARGREGHFTIADMAHLHQLVYELYECYAIRSTKDRRQLETVCGRYISIITNYFLGLMISATDASITRGKAALIVMMPLGLVGVIDQLDRLRRDGWKMTSDDRDLLAKAITDIFWDGFSSALAIFARHPNYSKCMIIVNPKDTQPKEQNNPIYSHKNVLFVHGVDTLKTAQLLNDQMNDQFMIYLVNSTTSDQTILRHYTGGNSNICHNTYENDDGRYRFKEAIVDQLEVYLAKLTMGAYFTTETQTETMGKHHWRISEVDYKH